MRALVFLLFWILTTSGSAPAQGQGLATLSGLVPGARIRVTSEEASPRVLVGLFLRLQDSLLVFHPDPAPRSIPVDLIESLELSRGRSWSRLGSVIGFLAGSVIGGAALGCPGNQDDYGVWCAGQNDSKFVIGAFAGGAAGAALGAFLFRQERWEMIEMPYVHDYETGDRK